MPSDRKKRPRTPPEANHPRCPTCGREPVEFRRQTETHHYPGRFKAEMKGGEVRYVCPEGHYYTPEGEPRGTSMPPDVTIEHWPW